MASHLDLIDDWPDRAAKSGYSIPELARLCRISRSQLRRYFAAKFGQSPHDWLNELRLRRAVELLHDGLTVKEAASALGYADSAHLCHRFKEKHGCAPLEFAKAALPPLTVFKPEARAAEKCAI